MSRYGDLVELEVHHVFTGEGPCRALHFELDAASLALADRTGLLIRGTGGSLRILYDEARADVLAALVAEGSLVLAGRLRSSDPSLAFCSEPPLMQLGRVLYLESSETPTHFIRDGKYVTRADLDRLMRDGERVTEADLIALMHDSEHVTEAGLIELTDARLGALLVSRDRGEQEAELELVELLGEGLAALLSPRDLLLPPIAFVVVRVDALELRRHRIHLDTLHSYWRYRVLGDLPESGATVVDAEGNVTFESLGTPEIGGGRTAATFLSTKRIPLRASGGPRFALYGESASRPRALVERLPLASIASTRRETVRGAVKSVSDIYVNL